MWHCSIRSNYFILITLWNTKKQRARRIPTISNPLLSWGRNRTQTPAKMEELLFQRDYKIRSQSGTIKSFDTQESHWLYKQCNSMLSGLEQDKWSYRCISIATSGRQQGAKHKVWVTPKGKGDRSLTLENFIQRHDRTIFQNLQGQRKVVWNMIANDSAQ